MKGTDVYKRIQARIREAEEKQEQLHSEIGAKDRQLDGDASRRDGVYVTLAEFYLPELGREAVDALRTRFPDVHARVREILEGKNEDRRVLDEWIVSNRKNRSQQARELDRLTGELEAKVDSALEISVKGFQTT